MEILIAKIKNNQFLVEKKRNYLQKIVNNYFLLNKNRYYL